MELREQIRQGTLVRATETFVTIQDGSHVLVIKGTYGILSRMTIAFDEDGDPSGYTPTILWQRVFRTVPRAGVTVATIGDRCIETSGDPQIADKFELAYFTNPFPSNEPSPVI